MKKKILIIISIIVTILLVTLFTLKVSGFFDWLYLYSLEYRRKPKINTPISYKIDWWGYQDGLTIDSFELEIVESKLNLFNNKAIIKYKIEGKMKLHKVLKPYIENIYINERFIERDGEKVVELIVQPIVSQRNDKKYGGETIHFEVENEHLLNTYRWGKNHYIFRCLDFKRELVLQQSK